MKLSPALRLVIWLVLLAGVAVFAAPLAWMVLTTLKLDHELVRRPVHWLPDLPAAPEQGPWTNGEGHEHRLGLGRVIAVTSSGEEITLEPVHPDLAWCAPMGTEQEDLLDPMGDESNPALREWDYRFPPVLDSVSARSTVWLPPEAEAADHWIVEVKNDLSFHRLWVHLGIGAGGATAGPHIIGNDESQDLVIRRQADPETERGDLVLNRPGTVREIGHSLQVTVILRRSSPLLAAWLKFTEQYRRCLQYLDFWSFTRNSVYLVVMNCIGVVLASSLVAYSFARLRWFGRDVLFVVLLATMMLPPQVTMVPQFLIWRGLGFYDTLVPLWLPAFLSVPFFVFLLRQFMLTIPRDLEDAALIDGCTRLRTWRQVILPLIKPALIAVAIFQFLWTWNDFMGPLIYVADPTLQPLSVGLYIFKQAFLGQWGMILAASTLMLVPVLVLFFCAQRYFIEGVTLTGLKA
jgi:multiple sugar transport system permease protein